MSSAAAAASSTAVAPGGTARFPNVALSLTRRSETITAGARALSCVITTCDLFASAVWAEPFTKLRLAKIFNLRTDPYEFADVTSNSYYEWFIYHAYILYGAFIIADKFAATFKDFPMIQKANSFTIDDAVAKMKEAVAGS